MIARKLRLLPALAAVAVLLLTVLPAAAQDGTLRLSLDRVFGYSMGGEIQGQFNLVAAGPDNLTSVTFYVDGQEMRTVAQAPFRVSFSTSNYALGKHTLSASGLTSDGQTLRSDERTVNMVSAGESASVAGRLLIPILVIAIIATVGSAWLSGRANRFRTPGEARHYGAAGGAICPKCGRPFALSMFGLNLFTGKLVRCPFCGKWSVVRRARPEALAAAEAAEAADAQPAVRELSEEEKLRRELEESRYA
jgi:hypothetical protein